jgi:putative addiction module killer protein
MATNTKWTIKYWSPSSGKSDVERWFKKELTHEQQKSVAKLFIMLEQCGNELKMPHSRSLGKKLLELRESRFGYRIYYMFHEGRMVILLAAGDKSTQQHDIKVARQRLAEVLKNNDEEFE